MNSSNSVKEAKAEGNQKELSKALKDFLEGRIDEAKLMEEERKLGNNYGKATLELTSLWAILKRSLRVRLKALVKG